MPLPAERLPHDLKSLSRKIAALERQFRERNAARRLEAATVGGGGLTVAEGGRFTMQTPSGVRMVDVGQISGPTWNHLDGSPQQAIHLRREDGSMAMSIRAQPSVQGVDTQAWTYWDRSGNPILAEDTTSGVGLALPYLPLAPWAPARYTDWLSTTSSTFEDIHRATIYKMQPWASVTVGHTTDVSGTTGQIQLTIGGTAYGSPTSVAFQISAVTVGPFQLPGDFRSQVELRIQARRTAGTGNVRCHVLASSGLQS